MLQQLLNYRIGLALLFLLTLLLLGWLGRIPSWLIGWYGLLSGVTFVCYARDKSAARQQQWRTTEATLHLLSLMGGWPGALVAQSLLRHKSQKQRFLLLFWITVVLNVLMLIGLI